MARMMTIIGIVLVITMASTYLYAKKQSGVQNIKAILIKLDVEDKPNMFLLLAADGSINRFGTGAIENTDKDMYIGTIKEPVFNELQSRFNNSWFEKYRAFIEENRKGKQCKLIIAVQNADGGEAGMQLLYGTDSVGLPTEIKEFTQTAVSLTNPWYTRQQEMVKK